LDEIDKKLLELLREDSRLTYTKMALILGVSEGTMRKRTRRLIASGVIVRFTIETTTECPEALVMISTSPTFSTSKVAEQIMRIRGIISVSEVAGQYDIFVIVSGVDISSVNDSIDAIRSINGIENTYTLFILRKWR
jgi:DNA-binding Lrp family transcriptional regulator